MCIVLYILPERKASITQQRDLVLFQTDERHKRMIATAARLSTIHLHDVSRSCILPIPERILARFRGRRRMRERCVIAIQVPKPYPASQRFT